MFQGTLRGKVKVDVSRNFEGQGKGGCFKINTLGRVSELLDKTKSVCNHRRSDRFILLWSQWFATLIHMVLLPVKTSNRPRPQRGRSRALFLQPSLDGRLLRSSFIIIMLCDCSSVLNQQLLLLRYRYTS